VKSSELLNEVMRTARLYDRAAIYAVVKAMLIAIRERLSTSEVAYLGNRLPTFLRAAYYDGWRPSLTPPALDGPADFIQAVSARLPGDMHGALSLDDTIEEAGRQLVLAIGSAELEPLRSKLPAQVTKHLATGGAQVSWELGRPRASPVPSPHL
ncbi:MAG TPA: DUF2267 domain-containing protein, partial [Bdellovibrionales bacterium]|nr:DUF2267 domain-containing protein [Bdellovibrionales bacterium]